MNGGSTKVEWGRLLAQTKVWTGTLAEVGIQDYLTQAVLQGRQKYTGLQIWPQDDNYSCCAEIVVIEW